MSKDVQTKIEGLNDNEFLLPVGYTDQDGVLHRVVTLTPMTGETEEAMNDPKVRDNGGKVITELLAGVTSGIGTVKRVNKEVIRDLTTIDRDFLILKNRQYSIGDEAKYMDICPHCRGKNQVVLDLSKIEASYLEDSDEREFTFDLPVGVADSNGVMHNTITIVFPTGRVQERIAPIVRSNPAQATTAMLQLITKRLGTMEFISPDVFKKMTKKDRDFISNKIADIEVGIKLSVDILCSECGSEFETGIPLQSLLGE